MTYQHIVVERFAAVALIRLNRPAALNALSSGLMADLAAAIDELEADTEIGAIVLTGNEKAFAAGADIKEMLPKDSMDAFYEDFLSGDWQRVACCRKPVIAAVAGYALGGGCELAMMCDFIIAADSAVFGQPEVKLGTMPGLGGTQRLTRAVGKAKAMEMCLTGRNMDATEAERAGLVARIVPADTLIDDALATAKRIAAGSRPSVMLIKEAVNRAYEVALREGLLFERRAFHATFSHLDKREGMQAFSEKRKPAFVNR